MAFKMKGFSYPGKSPAKQSDKYIITWSDEDAKKRHEEKIKKEEERKKKDQERIQQQIEGTYVETEEDMEKRRKETMEWKPKKKKD